MKRDDIVFTVVICFVIAIIGTIFLLGLGLIGSHTETVVGRVVQVEYSAGGWGSPDLTIFYLESGEVLVFEKVVSDIQIGKSYRFSWVVTISGDIVRCKVEEV